MDSLTGQLANIAAPTLVISGSRDQQNGASARTLAAALPNARLHILPQVGHFPNLECPQLVAELLTEFFTSCEQGHLALRGQPTARP